MLHSVKTRHSEPTTLILMSLLRGSKHGYAISKDLQETFHKDYGYGTLYGALKRLQSQGYIEACAGTNRRQPYRLTAKGHQLVKAEIKELIDLSLIGYKRLNSAANLQQYK